MEVKFETGDRAKVYALAKTAAFFAAAAVAAVVCVVLARSWIGTPTVMFASLSVLAAWASTFLRGSGKTEATEYLYDDARTDLYILSSYSMSALFASVLLLIVIGDNYNNLFAAEFCVLGGGLSLGFVLFLASTKITELARFLYNASLSQSAKEEEAGPKG